jgi:hypothetical protein
MSIFNDEIQKLQSRILELEKLKREEEIHHSKKKESIEHNFKIINNILNNKKTFIDNKRSYIENKYRENINKSDIDRIMNDKNNKYGAYEEQQVFTYLEAIYNILQMLDKRLSNLEDK